MIIHDATQKIQETKKLVLCFHGGSENNFNLVYLKNQFLRIKWIQTRLAQSNTKPYQGLYMVALCISKSISNVHL